MRIRSTAAVATVAAASMLAATPALATPTHSGTHTSSVAASTRTLNVPGVPVKASFPASWPAFSPKSIYNSHTRNYPAGVRYLARVKHESPTTLIASTRDVNLLGYGRPTGAAIPTFAVSDFGARNLTRAQLVAFTRHEGSKVTGYSTVKTRFGTVYRVHYRGFQGGLTFNGVTGIAHVKGHSIVTDVSSASKAEATSVSTTMLRTLARR